MEINKKQRKVKIIAEVHPQFFGSMNELGENDNDV